jgi:hypothetical protein
MACTRCGTLAPGAFCKSCGQSTGHVETKPAVPVATSSEAIVGAAAGISLANSVVDGEQVEDLPTIELSDDQSSVSQSSCAFEDELPAEQAGWRKRKLFAGILAFSVALLAIGISLVIASADSGDKQAEMPQSQRIEEPVSTTTSAAETTTTTIDLSFLNPPPAPAAQPERSSASRTTTAQAEWNAQIQEKDRMWRLCNTDAQQLDANLRNLQQAANVIDPSDPLRAAADSAAEAARISRDAKFAECIRLQDEGLALLRNPPR